mmetsp:Transcript_30708/g.63243  ORF Transcript_30708/g.63243 Transcript_30708/m.63243 type:complete len:625 (-) Transcript_30708:41-1915(-)
MAFAVTFSATSVSRMLQIFCFLHGLFLTAASTFYPTTNRIILHPKSATGSLLIQHDPRSQVCRSAAYIIPRGGGERSDDNISFDVDFTSSEEIDFSDDERGNRRNYRGPPYLFSFASRKSMVAALKHYASFLFTVARNTCQAGARAIYCNDNSDSEEDAPMVHTLFEKTAHVFGEMYKAASISKERDISSVGDNEEKPHHKGNKRRRQRKNFHYSAKAVFACNGGGISEIPESNHDAAIMQLARQYGAEISTFEDDPNKPVKNYQSILLSSSTSLSEALQQANGDARFLLCYISPKPQSKQAGISKNNKVVITNLLNPRLVKSANKKPLGKKQVEFTGSFYIWICNGDNDSVSVADISLAMKRLKVKPPTSSSGSKKKRASKDSPILAIFYPASAIDPSSPNRLKVTPRLLAQHHCHPPPTTAESLVAWMSTIRKRHLREFAKLQHDRKEAMLLEERNKGYISSMKEDAERQLKEEQELKRKNEEKEYERMRQEQLEQRREELLEALSPEPEAGTKGVITIALRFKDGSRDQRRFVAAETTINDVFNWIDCVHKMEREKVTLTTMNGQKSFVYENEGGEGDEANVGDEVMTLEDSGLGRMTAFRVSDFVQESGEQAEDDDFESE